jgi:thiol-disulfide isomerase/thioredoxin
LPKVKINQKIFVMAFALKISLCILFFIGFLLPSVSQSLDIGQQIPDFATATFNSTPSLQFSRLRGRVIIIDFWGTGCLACIASFSKIDSLQKLFKDKIQIVLVNKESEDSTRKFFRVHKKIRLPSVPIIAGDTVLNTWFPHEYVPHAIWIDQQGIIRAITDGYNITKTHIEQLLNSNRVDLALKKDMELRATPNSSGILEAATEAGTLRYFSCFTGEIRGIGNTVTIRIDPESGKKNKIIMVNATLLDLCKIAYGDFGKIDLAHSNCIIIQTKDRSKYYRPVDPNAWDKWNANNLFCYELMVDPANSDALLQTMQNDLRRFFKIDVEIKSENINCLVLVKKNKTLRPSRNTTPTSNLWIKSNEPIKYAYNIPFQHFLSFLKICIDQSGIPTPLLNQTGFEGNIDFEINANDLKPLNLKILKEQLNRYGFNLIEQNVLTNVLNIKD